MGYYNWDAENNIVGDFISSSLDMVEAEEAVSDILKCTEANVNHFCKNYDNYDISGLCYSVDIGKIVKLNDDGSNELVNDFVELSYDVLDFLDRKRNGMAYIIQRTSDEGFLDYMSNGDISLDNLPEEPHRVVVNYNDYMMALQEHGIRSNLPMTYSEFSVNTKDYDYPHGGVITVPVDTKKENTIGHSR